VLNGFRRAMRSLERIASLLPWCSSIRPSVCPSRTGVHCDHAVHFSGDVSLWLDSPMFGTLWRQSMSTSSQPSFPVPPGRQVGYGCAKWAWYLKNGWRYWVLIRSRICRVDWHNNGWPWLTLNGRVARYLCGSWACCCLLFYSFELMTRNAPNASFWANI